MTIYVGCLAQFRPEPVCHHRCVKSAVARHARLVGISLLCLHKFIVAGTSWLPKGWRSSLNECLVARKKKNPEVCASEQCIKYLHRGFFCVCEACSLESVCELRLQDDFRVHFKPCPSGPQTSCKSNIYIQCVLGFRNEVSLTMSWSNWHQIGRNFVEILHQINDPHLTSQ